MLAVGATLLAVGVGIRGSLGAPSKASPRAYSDASASFPVPLPSCWTSLVGPARSSSCGRALDSSKTPAIGWRQACVGRSLRRSHRTRSASETCEIVDRPQPRGVASKGAARQDMRSGGHATAGTAQRPSPTSPPSAGPPASCAAVQRAARLRSRTSPSWRPARRSARSPAPRPTVSRRPQRHRCNVFQGVRPGGLMHRAARWRSYIRTSTATS